MQVTSGEAANGPFMEVSSGSPLGDVSESECQAYGGSNWGGDGNENNPQGCILVSSYIFYSAAGTEDCSSSKPCIQKNPEYDEARYVNEAECEAYALSMGDSDGLTSLTNNYPVGCFKRTSGYFYGSGTDGTLCTTTNACIQKQIPDPDYVSLEECKAYAASIAAVNTNTPQTYGNIRPSGCFDASGGYIYFNTVASSTDTCSTSYPCIKKNLQRDLRYVSAEELSLIHI